MSFKKITEQDSNYSELENKTVKELIDGIHIEDQNAVKAVGNELNSITTLIKNILIKLKNGGRLFYIGAGTSGRLGVLDASECPTTYGTNPEMVRGVIAGGDYALRNSIENAEDDPHQGWNDLKKYFVDRKDFVIGITASGNTPYVVGTLKICQEKGIATGSISCNPGSPILKFSNFPVTVIVGPEFVTGSSRMKAGTAQKLILNMISTAVMIKLGKVKGNKMIDIQMTNNKLFTRGTKILMDELSVDFKTAAGMLKKHQSIRKAIKSNKGKGAL